MSKTEIQSMAKTNMAKPASSAEKALATIFSVAALGGLVTGFVYSIKGENGQYTSEYPSFAKDELATVVGHEYKPASSHIGYADINPPILRRIKDPERFLLNLKQTRQAYADGKKEQVFVTETDQVTEIDYNKYHNGDKIVIAKVLEREHS